MPDDNGDRRAQNVRLSRRKLLAMSAGAAAGIAGCGGGGGGGSGGTTTTTTTTVQEMGMGGDETTTTTTTTAEEGGEETTTTQTQANGDPYPNPEGEILDKTLNIPSDGTWNPEEWNANVAFAANTQNPSPWEFQHFIQGSEVAVNGTNPLIALNRLDVTDGGCTVVWEMREGDTWWDGTPVTNQDLLTHRLLQRYQQFGPNPSESTENSPKYNGPEIELEGDKIIRFRRRSPINPNRALLNARYRWQVKHDHYKPFLDRFRDATTVKENDTITKELTNHEISIDEFAQGLGNMLWKPVEWSGTSVTYEIHEGHPRSEWTNIPNAHLEVVPDTTKRIEGYKADKYDMGVSANDPIRNIMDQIPDMQMIREFPYLYYRGFRFNFRDKHASRRGVRRAFAYLMDQQRLQDSQMSSNGYKTFPVHQTGMAVGVEKNFLGEDFVNQLIDYGQTTQKEKAFQELRNEGYTRQNGEWVGPDGEPLKITIQAAQTAREKTSTQFAASYISQFGFNVEPQFVSGTNFWSNITNQYNKLPSAIRLFGGGPHPSIPYVNWNAQVVELPNQVAKPQSTGSVGDCGSGKIGIPELKVQETPRWKRPVRPDYPKEVGDPAAPEDTETQTLLPILWDRQMHQSQSFEQVRELARKLAWYQNWQMTDVAYYTESWSGAGDITNFFWGDGSFNEDWFREPYRWWTRGIVQGRTEPYDGEAEGPLAPQR